MMKILSVMFTLFLAFPFVGFCQVQEDKVSLRLFKELRPSMSSYDVIRRLNKNPEEIIEKETLRSKIFIYDNARVTFKNNIVTNVEVRDTSSRDFYQTLFFKSERKESHTTLLESEEEKETERFSEKETDSDTQKRTVKALEEIAKIRPTPSPASTSSTSSTSSRGVNRRTPSMKFRPKQNKFQRRPLTAN